MDIILMIFLSMKIGKLAYIKGLPAGRWRLYFMLGWIVGEVIGMLIGITIFGADNIVSWALVALAGALAAYFIIQNYLTRLPDEMADDINNIGR